MGAGRVGGPYLYAEDRRAGDDRPARVLARGRLGRRCARVQQHDAEDAQRPERIYFAVYDFSRLESRRETGPLLVSYRPLARGFCGADRDALDRDI